MELNGVMFDMELNSVIFDKVVIKQNGQKIELSSKEIEDILIFLRKKGVTKIGNNVILGKAYYEELCACETKVNDIEEQYRMVFGEDADLETKKDEDE